MLILSSGSHLISQVRVSICQCTRPDELTALTSKPITQDQCRTARAVPGDGGTNARSDKRDTSSPAETDRPVMSLHKLPPGDGYTYLARQAAAHDTSVPTGGLGAYYMERVSPPAAGSAPASPASNWSHTHA